MIRILIDQVSPDGTVQELAGATVTNISHLADVSDYAVYVTEHDNYLVPRRRWESRGLIGRHDRRQSVWSLVARAAFWAAQEAEKR